MGDLSLPGSHGGVVLLDSETGSTRGVEVTRATEEQYATVLREHNEEVRRHCLSVDVSYTEARLLESHTIEQCALSTVRRMGLFI